MMRLGHSRTRREDEEFSRSAQKPGRWARLCNRYARAAAKTAAAFAFVASIITAPLSCNNDVLPPYPDACDASTCNGRDAGVDGGISDGRDAGVDGGISDGEDGGSDAGMGDGDSDDVVVPTGTTVAENLIGDFLNRQLMDRGGNVAGNAETEYPLGGPDTSENANPFTDGSGGDIGRSRTFLYRVDGSQFTPFASVLLEDVDSGDRYIEMQALWLEGDNHFDRGPDDVVGRLEFVAYSLKFDGPDGKEIGIPVCSIAENSDYTYCKTGEFGVFDDATESHRLKVWFLGEEWIVSEMNAPVGSLPDENGLLNGGSIKLAKEAAGGILEQGQSLPIDNLKFQLDDLEGHNNDVAAIISVFDENGTLLKKDKVSPGQTKEFNIQGKVYPFHVYKVAPDYTFGSIWADVAIFAEEIELSDGEHVVPDTYRNPDYIAILGWKNLDATATSDSPDTLRTVIVYSDDIEDLSTSWSENLQAGDYIPLLQDPTLWKLYYEGLDISSTDRHRLRFGLQTINTTIHESKGPIIGGEQVSCLIRAPSINVVSSATGSVFIVERTDANGGMLSDNEFQITLNNGAACDTNHDGTFDTELAPNTVFMRVSPSSDDYGIVTYTTDGVSVMYGDIGSDDEGNQAVSFNAGGVIHIESRQDVERGAQTGVGDDAIGDMLESTGTGNSVCISAECADVYIAIAELAGTGPSSNFVNYWIIGAARTGTASPRAATFDFDSMAQNGFTLTSASEELLYGHATPNKPSAGTPGSNEFYDPSDNTGPVSSGVETVSEGYVSERGSVFRQMDTNDRNVEFDMSHKPTKAKWVLKE